MKRVLLVHWNAEEAEERAERLRRVGYEVDCHSDQRSDPNSLLEDPPDAVVIDLNRAPSHGREFAGWLRRHKATRGVPLVFIGGDPEKTKRARDLLPDAAFTAWATIGADLAQAIAHPPKDPVVPGTMDAYAGAPLPKKLGISSGAIVALLGAPQGFDEMLGRLPDDVRVVRTAEETADVILLFATSKEQLERTFGRVADTLAQGGRLWICWPKKASGVSSDLSQTVVRAFGLARGFVDYKISSIDETWSGLCFAGGRAEPLPRAVR